MASNQVPVAEKARIISESWGIPFEEVRKIQKKEVKDCTFEELRIRYNDRELGQFPDWFNMQEARTIVKNAVNSKWQDVLSPTYDREDLYIESWMKIMMATKRIKEVGEADYKKFIYRIATNHVTYTTYYHVQSLKHFKTETQHGDADAVFFNKEKSEIKRLPEVIYNLNETDPELREEDKLVYVADGGRKESQEDLILDSLEEEMDMLHTIKSIKDDTIRDLISIAAYTLANIDSFKGLYDEAVARMTEPKRKKFFEILEGNSNKELDFKKILKLIVGKDTNTYFVMISDYLQKLMTKSDMLAEV